MQVNLLSTSRVILTTILFIVASLSNLHAAYNGECWVISGGDTVLKLYPDGQADPKIIPNLTHKSAKSVHKATGRMAILTISPCEKGARGDFLP